MFVIAAIGFAAAWSLVKRKAVFAPDNRKRICKRLLWPLAVTGVLILWTAACMAIGLQNTSSDYLYALAVGPAIATLPWTIFLHMRNLIREKWQMDLLVFSFAHMIVFLTIWGFCVMVISNNGVL